MKNENGSYCTGIHNRILSKIIVLIYSKKSLGTLIVTKRVLFLVERGL